MDARHAAAALAKLADGFNEVPGLRTALRTIAEAILEDRFSVIAGRLDAHRRERLMYTARTQSSYYRDRDLNPDLIDFDASIWIRDQDHEPGTDGDVYLMFERDESAVDFAAVYDVRPNRYDPCIVRIGDTDDVVVLPDEYAWLENQLEDKLADYDREKRERTASLSGRELRALYCADEND